MTYRPTEKRFTPKPLNRSYNLCGYEFQLFSLYGYKFDKGLNVPKQKGLYSFTNFGNRSSVTPFSVCGKVIHAPLYLGETSEKDGLWGRLTSNHDYIKAIHDGEYERPMVIGIYLAETDEDTEDIETEILQSYYYIRNTQKNYGHFTFIIEN